MLKSAPRTTALIVSWYLRYVWKQPHDGGLFPWLSNRDLLGDMAVEQQAVGKGDDRALFHALITLAMFQRLRDTYVARILRSIPKADAEELTSSSQLYQLAKASGCVHSGTQEGLLKVCDLAKEKETRLATCSANPTCDCHLKRHTTLLRRYGHFGKIPTSAALALFEAWEGSLSALHVRVLREHDSPLDRARALEAEISRVWRVNKKVASMFLSVVSAPDLGLETPPWQEGIDWSWFLPIDVNIDKFLFSMGWAGPWSYDARRQAVLSLSRKVALSRIHSGLRDYNPRLVLQAINRFMSSSNRREAATDCSHLAPVSCATCPPALRGLCPFGELPV